MNIAVIIPALNPDEKLLRLVQQIKDKSDLPIIVVDDGSDAKSRYIFEECHCRYGCIVSTHPNNKGKGAALKTGMETVQMLYPGMGCVTADADGQHSADDIINVAHSLSLYPQSLIMGTRDFSGQNVPFKSRWGNRITAAVFKAQTGAQCPDTQTGLRGIPATFIPTCILLKGERFEYEMNMLVSAAKEKVPFKIVAIQTIYLEKNKSSHFHAIKDSILVYRGFLLFAMASLLSAVVDIGLFAFLNAFLYGVGGTGAMAATIAARVFSSGVNFTLNRKWVFKSKNAKAKEIVKYGMLFVFQMLLSGLLVSAFAVVTTQLTLAKILVDSLLFFFGFWVQKNFVFKEKEKPEHAYKGQP